MSNDTYPSHIHFQLENSVMILTEIHSLSPYVSITEFLRVLNNYLYLNM